MLGFAWIWASHKINLEAKHQLWRRRGVLVKGLGVWLKILMLCVGERRDER